MNVANLLLGMLILATPLLLAGLGGWASERGGVIHIALEGAMTIATVVCAWVSMASDSPGLGLLAGILASVLLSAIHWLLTQVYRIDHVVSGMSLNAAAIGLAGVFDRVFHLSEGKAAPALPVGVFVGLSWIAMLGFAFLSDRTKFGLYLRASGADPAKARQLGIEPIRIRLAGLMFSGVLCGLAGAFLISNAAGYYTDGMTAGRGYIALAALILGGWKPRGVLLASYAFAFFMALQIQMQGSALFGIQVPREVWYCLPYAATIAALALSKGKTQAPAGLGRS